MKTIIAAPGIVLQLGRRGENAARKIVFDITDWRAEFGDNGIIALLAQRPGDTEPYPVAVTVSGSSVTWLVSAADTTKPGVYGQAELQYRIGDVVVKSAIWRTFIADSLGTPSPTPPDPQQAWVDQVLDAAQMVETATVNGPKIQGGTWWVWDFENEHYVDTGVQAQGPAGVTPAPIHINMEAEYGIDVVGLVLQETVLQGQTEAEISFSDGKNFLAAIKRASGPVWLDLPLNSVGMDSIYSTQLTGVVLYDGSVGWVDVKIAVNLGNSWLALYLGINSNYIYAKVTESPVM